ncbi:ATPase family associated with various cellular activities, putative isoform 2 [Hibiscus syriacus]|uniref:ATPase family associated with various cellular activities, putative isoform 2 n=1 Tax=Hibiscus syriacus TaxID=106335 RepID=A0A6A3D3K5_HIBSY|nr:ATPase family associated with various cellular activities, putative isoform 2 [Hibiscus syriacus]
MSAQQMHFRVQLHAPDAPHPIRTSQSQHRKPRHSSSSPGLVAHRTRLIIAKNPPGLVGATSVHVTNFIAGMNDERNNKCSPYYKGLTDSTLSINREKNMSGADSSPGRESQATTAANSSSSFSSLFGKVQEYGSSCFTCRTSGDHYKEPSTPADVLKPVKVTSFSSSTSNKTTTRIEKKEVDDPPDVQLVVEEKPLRERVWEPATTPVKAPVILSADGTVVEQKDADVCKVHQKYVLADKYRPKTLKDFICNRSEVTRLQALTRDERKAFHLKGEAVGRIEVDVKESSKHVEVNLSDLRGYEKHVIVELMKETQTKNSKPNKALSNDPEDCRTIILCEADRLSPDALLYIRWLLERYKAGNKVFFCCSNVSKLQPIRSLCTLIKLLPPSKQEIVQVLEFIAKQEGLSLPHKLAEKIAESSKNNLRQAIRSFEACRDSWSPSYLPSYYPFKEDQKILTEWEEDIANIAKNMVEERSPKQLYIIRRKLQNLVEHDVSPLHIHEVKKHLQDSLHPLVDCLYEEYNRDDENMIESEDDMETKDSRIFSRIEEFIARFMSWYNKQSKMASAALANFEGT